MTATTTNPQTDHIRSFPARRQGICVQCNRPIHIGDHLLYSTRVHDYVHVNCYSPTHNQDASAPSPTRRPITDQARDIDFGQLPTQRAPQSTQDATAAQSDNSITPTHSVAPQPRPLPRPVPDGTYTVVHQDDTYHTLRVQTCTVGQLRGKTIISFLSGPNNDNNYTGCAFYDPQTNQHRMWSRYRDNNQLISGILTLTSDYRIAGHLYALRSNRCWHCGRTLTVLASIHLGLGPICAQNLGL